MYLQPAHVVHGVSLHLFPMSWSWIHFKLLPLSSLRSRCAPHPSLCYLFFPERTSSEDWCDAYPHTDVSAQSMSPSPCLLHGVDSLTLSRFHPQHSGLLPCTHCLHSCVCLFVCMGWGGRGRLQIWDNAIPITHPAPKCTRRYILSLKVSVFPTKRMAIASLCAWPPSHVGVGVCRRGVCVGGTTRVYGCVWGVYLVAPSPIVLWRSVWYSVVF
jgi:hypothetical protein